MSNNKNRIYGEFNIPIDVWNPNISSQEFIMRIQQAVKEEKYSLALDLYDQAEEQASLEGLNTIRSSCAMELIAARQWRKSIIAS